MKTSRHGIIGYVVFLLWLGTVQATAQELWRYTFRHIGPEQGFPANYINCFYQDRKGYIWMGTDIGLVRYDGRRFRVWHNRRHDQRLGYLNAPIQRIKEDQCGWLWLFQGGVNEYFNILDPAKDTVYTILGSNHRIYEWKDSVFLSTNTGVRYFDRKTMTIGDTFGLGPYRVAPRPGSEWTDHQGRFWARKPGKGMVCFDPATRTFYDKKNNPFRWKLMNLDPGLTWVVPDTAGNVWMATGWAEEKTNEFYYYNFKTNNLLRRDFQQYRFKTNHRVVHQPVVLTSGQVWMGIGDGLCRYFREQDSFECIFAGYEGLPNSKNIHNMLADREGNIWVPTNNGIALFNPARQSVKTLRMPKGKEPHKPEVEKGNLLQTPDGDIYVAYPKDGMYRMNARFQITDTLRQRYDEVADLYTGYIAAMVETEEGKIWIGGENDTITAYNPITRQTTPVICTACKPGLIHRMFKARNGDIWIANAKNHIVRWDARERRFFPVPLPSWSWFMENEHVTVFYEDGIGRIWAGTYGAGVFVLHPRTGEILEHIQADKVFTQKEPTLNGINALLPWNRDTIVAGTANGLCFIDLKQKQKSLVPFYLDKQPLFHSVINLHRTPDGDVWIVDPFRVRRLNRRTQAIKTYRWDDGLTPQQYTSALCRLQDGRLLVGTRSDDIAIFETGPVLPPAPLDAPVFTELKIGDSTLYDLDSFVNSHKVMPLRHNQNNLTFAYASLTYGISDITYAYQLTGLGTDTTWVQAGDRREANYYNLPPGEYTFRVRALGGEGQITAVTALSFVIHPPWWRTAWFYGLSGLALFALIFLIARDRIRRFRERVTYQKRLSDLENQALRAQINPHFIFNALSAVKQFVLENDVEQAEYYMSRFSTLMRQILANSGQIAVPLRQELDLLDNYLQLEQLRFGHTWDYRIEVADEVEADIAEVPSMALQPFVENAVLHGLANLREERRGLLKVCGSLKDGGILIEIEDNGVGRQKAETLKNALRREHHRSAGLSITARRLALFSEGAPEAARYTITDLTDEAGAGCGTRVELWLPQ